jgi:hypothetical protein
MVLEIAAILIMAFHERANTRFAPTMARKSASDVGVNLVFTQQPGKIRIAVEIGPEF